jgi:tyrosine-protein kinase Etk/Wzc
MSVNNGNRHLENGNGNYMQRVKNNFKRPDEIDYARIFRIINRRKIILVLSVLFVLGLVFLYNSLSKPVYESTVLLKKERTDNRSHNTDELANILSLQSPAQIETEMELVKTSEVLSKTIDELNLHTRIDRIEKPNGKTTKIDDILLNYNKDYIGQDKNSSFPHFLEVKVTSHDKNYKLYITKESNDSYKLYHAEKDSLLQESRSESAGVFSMPDLNVTFYWPDAEEGSRVYFDVASLSQTRRSLNKRIKIEQRAKTDVFEVTVQSSSPYAARMIANTLTENFRQARIDQQKQTIRYSSDFVDNNLEDITKRLEEAEKNLSEYKSTSQIMDIEGSSEDLVRFISNLEAEKMNAELQLAEYTNKFAGMEGELKSKGFFDQTFLTPQGADPTNSPFSVLMRQLSDLELQRLELLQRRKESHPDVVNVDTQIRQVKDKLTNYNENTLTSYQIIIGSLRKKIVQLDDLLKRYEGKMRTLPSQENQLASLIRQRNVFQKMYTLLLDKREEMRMAELSKLQDIVVVDEAREPIEPVLPRKSFNLAAGMIFGVLIGFIGIFLVEMKNKKLVSLDDIENDFRLPIFAIIPNYNKDLSKRIDKATNYEDRLVTLMDDQEGFKETFRVLRTKLSTVFDNGKKVIMFTSCEENTGKTSIVANLGISLAQSRKRVLLIDFDLRKGALSKMFDIDQDSPGLISYLKRKIPQPYIYNKGLKTLDVLPAGGISENSSDLLGPEQLQDLLDLIDASAYDYVLVDTPPVTRVVDTLVLGKSIKDAVLIIRPDYTFKESVVWGLQEMEHENIKVAGTVVNAGDIEKSVFRYRYGYGYGYSYGKKEAESVYSE